MTTHGVEPGATRTVAGDGTDGTIEGVGTVWRWRGFRDLMSSIGIC
jgi:hypothetical protein